jgi:hypothetical protein
MWTTLRKREREWFHGVRPPVEEVRIRRITNAQNSEPVAPASGRFAALSLWVENLPEECDLIHLEVYVGEKKGRLTYIGPREHDGMAQVNLRLPEGLGTGLQPVRLAWRGETLGAASKVRIVPRPAAVPRVVALSDGINLMSGPRIETRTVKLTLEEAANVEGFSATVDGEPVEEVDVFCTDPLPPRHEVNFRLPKAAAPGEHVLQIRLGGRALAPVGIEVTA